MHIKIFWKLESSIYMLSHGGSDIKFLIILLSSLSYLGDPERVTSHDRLVWPLLTLVWWQHGRHDVHLSVTSIALFLCHCISLLIPFLPSVLLMQHDQYKNSVSSRVVACEHNADNKTLVWFESWGVLPTTMIIFSIWSPLSGVGTGFTV